MCEAFSAHFRDRFARCPGLSVQEFCSDLANISRLREAEAASCEGLVMRSPWCVEAGRPQQIVRTKMVYPYEVYFRLLHMFVPILTDIFNHWFARGAIPGSVTKGVVTLLKKGGRHVWEDLDDYRPIKDFGLGLSEPMAACHEWFDRTRAELRCKGKINPRRLALGARDPWGVRRQHQSRTDQGLW